MTLSSDAWLITGGCGFIGTSLVAHLLRLDAMTNIRILDNLSVGSMTDLGEVCEFSVVNLDKIAGSPRGVELVVGDIRSADSCLAASRGVHTIVHLAANTGVAPSVADPRGDMEANVVGTFNVLEAARQNGAKSFIFASSGAPLGEVEPPITEEKAPKPVSPYGASKLAGEAYCSAFNRTFGLKTAALRFGNVYGPRAKHKESVVAKFFKRALAGEPLEIYGDGGQTRDFIYIDDLVQAIVLAANVDVGGEVFQIATHRETTVEELTGKIRDIVEAATGRPVNIQYSRPRVGDVRRNYSDISKARRMLGFAPRFDIDAGLKETFAYFRSMNEPFAGEGSSGTIM